MNKLKILIVDDDPDILDLLESTLAGEFHLVKAATGKEALEKVKTQAPNLLVLLITGFISSISCMADI